MQQIRIVVVGACGAFGRCFSELLNEHSHVTRVDIKDDIAGDESHVLHPERDREDVASATGRADIILFCMSVTDLLGTVGPYLDWARDNALIMDICSTKVDLIAGLAKCKGYSRVDHLSIHPMFGPTTDFTDQNVVCATSPSNEFVPWFRSRLESWGANVHDLSAEDHDLAVTATQVLCHAAIMSYGLAIAGLGLSPESLAAVETPNSRVLLSLVSRISRGNPELFRSIQMSADPANRRRLADAAMQFADQLEGDDPAPFAAIFSTVSAWFGDKLDSYGELAKCLHQAQRGWLAESRHRD
jgi:prephenate dehydrogenase